MQVIIENREQVHETTAEGTQGDYLHLFVRATVITDAGTRTGPFNVELPADAPDAQLQDYIAGLFGG